MLPRSLGTAHTFVPMVTLTARAPPKPADDIEQDAADDPLQASPAANEPQPAAGHAHVHVEDADDGERLQASAADSGSLQALKSHPRKLMAVLTRTSHGLREVTPQVRARGASFDGREGKGRWIWQRHLHFVLMRCSANDGAGD